MDPADPPALRRRMLLGAGIGLAAGGALVWRNQLRHPYRDKSARPDGRFRRVVLASPHPAHDAVLIAAQRLGVFARYNLDVTLVPGLLSGQEALDRLRPGDADVAVAPALSWLPRLLAGLDAKLVAGLQSGSARLLVPRGSPVKRIEDLYRHAIGIADSGTGSAPSADRLFFSIMMRRKGMNPDRDVTWAQMPPDQFQPALEARRILAVVGHDPVIWQLRESAHMTELASSMTGSYGTRVSRVLGIRDDLLQSDPPLAVQMVLAFQEAAVTVSRHLDEVASVMADELPDMELPEIARMLHAEGHAVHPADAELREQMAQYIDELKLLALVPDTLDSARAARGICDIVVRD